MSRLDFYIAKHAGPVRVHDVDDRTGSSLASKMLVGEPIKSKTPATAGEFCEPMADGDGVIGTDLFLGIAAKDSTETSSVDGTIDIHTPLPNRTVIRGKATTSGNIDTTAELLALKGHWIGMDDTSSVYTFDEDDTSDPNGFGFQIIGGDIVKGTVDCVVHISITQGGTTI